jgi:hypothetical protein
MYRSAILALLVAGSAFAQQKASKFPYPERLSYRVEWRLITAGTATVELSRGTPDDWEINLDLESAGTVAKLYRVLDKYRAVTDDGFCTASVELDAQQGKRHRITRLAFDNSTHKVSFVERDLVKHSTESKQVAIAPCTHDIVAALALLRTMKIDPGQWASVPVTNGKKMAFAKIHGLGREAVDIGGKTYQTDRYEAFLFNDVLYKRKGRLLIWLTADAARVPVQFRFQLGFPVGTISLELEKQEKR